jgi:hypothetical protein
MAKRAKRKTPEEFHLQVEIEDHLTHYAFSGRFPKDRAGPLLRETLTTTAWGTVVSPKEKRGRDIQLTLTGSEEFSQPIPSRPADAPAARIGALFWGADRVASIYLPPSSFWALTHGIVAGHLKRISLTVDAPLRGNVAIRSVHVLTRELVLRIGKTTFGDDNAPANDEE